MRRQLWAVWLWIADLFSDPVEIGVCVRKRHLHTAFGIARIEVAELPVRDNRPHTLGRARWIAMSDLLGPDLFSPQWYSAAPDLVAELSSDLGWVAVCVDHACVIPCRECLYEVPASTPYSDDPEAIARVHADDDTGKRSSAEPNSLAGAHAQPLPPLEQARWNASTAALRDWSAALTKPDSTDEELSAAGRAWIQTHQVPLDPAVVRDALHVPADAGEWAPALERILRRIPDGWGRWISCQAGWYPMLARLDDDISTLLPHYEIHQVKEKLGGLRYYWSLCDRALPCCDQFRQSNPRPKVVGGSLAEETRPAIRAWDDQFRAHKTTREHLEFAAVDDARRRALQSKVDVANALVRATEEESARTCELCGRAGTLRVDRGWYRTLCTICADERGAANEGSDSESSG